jgi:tetratricopeptide (TPR) repeat protein
MIIKRAGLSSAISLLFVVIAVGACGRSRGATSPDSLGNGSPASEVASSMPPPPWLVPYDPEQQKLLSLGLEAPVQQAAPRVYPDLDRFTFTGESPINVPTDPIGYSKLIVQTIEQSPYLYVVRTGPPSLANVRALYGPEPEPEPDPWKRSSSTTSKELSLVPALPSSEARALIDRARSAQGAEAIDLLKKAAAISPTPPGLLAMLGDTALANNDLATAETAANEAIKLDPMFAPAHRIVSEVQLRRSDRERAKASIARALALYPASKRGWQVAASIVGRELNRDVAIAAPFIEVNSAGAIVVVSCDRRMCERYAECKAAFRYEPGLRAAVLHEAPSVGYHLSATEEVACLEAGLGAHLEPSMSPGQPPDLDPVAELLVRLARDQGLTGYALFEIIGRYRPEWLRVAPAAVHEAVTAYVLKQVLGKPSEQTPVSPSGAGMITATR